MQPGDQPERPGRRLVRERLVRPGEDRPYVDGTVECAEGVSELGGERAQRMRRMDRGAGGDDGQRQRQPGTATDDLLDGFGLGRDPVVAEPGGQQPPRVLGRQQVDGERMRPVRHHQPGEVIAAGHHDQAAGRPGQQRGHLGGVAGVVEQHQHAPPGQQAR